MFLGAPERQYRRDSQGVGSIISKCFRNICCHHPRNSVRDLICSGTSEISFRIYNCLKKILSHFLTQRFDYQTSQNLVFLLTYV